MPEEKSYDDFFDFFDKLFERLLSLISKLFGDGFLQDFLVKWANSQLNDKKPE